VFEIRAGITNFAAAVRRIPGLELVDEEELPADDDSAPTSYLLVPDNRALAQINSLWMRWQRGDNLGAGFAPWRDMFSLLRDLRPWGPQDRIVPSDAQELQEEVDKADDGTVIRLEVELVFRPDDARANQAVADVAMNITGHGGSIVRSSRIKPIAYHALLIDLPSGAVKEILGHAADSIAAADAVMHIRPQSIASGLDVQEAEASGAGIDVVEPLGEPILALLDGVPIARHRLLSRHLVVGDVFALEASAQVESRFHGTAMASLVIHGDRNNAQEPLLPRKIYTIPVLSAHAGHDETFPSDQLIVDVIYRAVVSMREGADASAPAVIIVNLSLGNRRKKFHGQVSAWARLLDYLAYAYGILFVVSAGNATDSFACGAFGTRVAFEDSPSLDRSIGVVKGLGTVVAERRIISPAESVNAITVGASNQDAVPDQYRRGAAMLIDPYPAHLISNPSSSLGPGVGGSVKPDILLPGARERLSVVSSNGNSVSLRPGGASRACGLKVASPGVEGAEGFTNGTSAAAALASRTCHRIHDALENTYGMDFLRLPTRHRAALLKALLCHTARWPSETAQLIIECLGPDDPRQHVRRKDNVRRLIGFGVVNPDDAVACASDRATFWATGEIRANEIVTIPIPIPLSMGQQAIPHELCATASWITPTLIGLRAYRSVRLKLLEPEDISTLGVRACSEQPDSNQTNRGTVFSRRWVGQKAAAVTQDMSLRLKVQREPDISSTPVDEPIPFGVAVTISMPGVDGIYLEVAQRLRAAAIV